MAAGMGMISLFLAGPILYGKTRMETVHNMIAHSADKGLAMKALLVQGNFNLMDRWSGMGFYRRIQKYLEMTGTTTNTYSKRIVVWPETVLNAVSHLDDVFFAEIMQHIGPNTVLISGGLKEDTSTGGIFNSAYLISGNSGVMRYDKHILLPYAETLPLMDILGSYYTAPHQFQAGSSPGRFQTDHGNVGISICFEILYPDYIRKTVANGAEFLANISNDAWFGKTSMPHMHLNAGLMRAIENRRYLLRASNSGISAVIAPDGRILR